MVAILTVMLTLLQQINMPTSKKKKKEEIQML